VYFICLKCVLRRLFRAQELEDQLRELEESVRKRNPDSIANLIRAVKPSESQEFKKAGMCTYNNNILLPFTSDIDTTT
jgi:hypothetical protein